VGEGEVHSGLAWKKLMERDQLEDLSVDEDNIKMDIQETGWGRGLD
jgi:hypothetical protein